MNSLVLFPYEVTGEKAAQLAGERAKLACLQHELAPGVTTKVSVWGGRRGVAEVKSASHSAVDLILNLTLDPLNRVPIDLIVSVPRPQTVKKIIQFAASAGIRSLHFVQTYNTDKSYLSSRTLRESEIQEEIRKSLEQVYDSLPVPVFIHRSFREFVAERLQNWNAPYDIKLIADTCDARTLKEIVGNKSIGGGVIAIGPELGWTDGERELFGKEGFIPVSLGPRMLRVEHAAMVLTAQLMDRFCCV